MCFKQDENLISYALPLVYDLAFSASFLFYGILLFYKNILPCTKVVFYKLYNDQCSIVYLLLCTNRFNFHYG